MKTRETEHSELVFFQNCKLVFYSLPNPNMGLAVSSATILWSRIISLLSVWKQYSVDGRRQNWNIESSFLLWHSFLDTLQWTCVKLELPILARAGHAALCLPYRHDNNEQDDVVLFGGGNNDGTFFQDLVSLFVPLERIRVSTEPSPILH